MYGRESGEMFRFKNVKGRIKLKELDVEER
jgi:hypothetical protein